MSGSGFGICGHKNVYSSGVLNGNWAEDRICKELTGHSGLACDLHEPQERQHVAVSEKCINQINERLNHSETYENDPKNKPPLSYSVLFGHDGASNGSERFLTTHQISYTGEGSQKITDKKDNIGSSRPASTKVGSTVKENNTLRNVFTDEYKGGYDIESDGDTDSEISVIDFRRRKLKIAHATNLKI